jgi:hypothetical protein
MTTRTRTRQAPPPSRLNAVSIIGDVIAVAIGLGGSFTVHLVGELPVAEVGLTFLLPILIVLRGRRLHRPRLKVVFYLIGLWLFGQVLTDLYRRPPARDWMRGDAGIIFFAIDLVCIAVLLGRNEGRKVKFIAAFAIGSLLAARYQPIDLYDSDPWKFGYSYGANLFVVLVSCYFYRRRQYVMVGILLAGMMGASLIDNYRGPILGLLLTIVLVIPVIPEQIGRLRILPRTGSASRVAVLAGLVFFASWSASGILHLASSFGLLGEEAQNKNEVQAKAKGGLLLGGRPEILVSSRAVLDSPILGHGSGAKDQKYVEMLNDLQAEYGAPVNLSYATKVGGGLIPTHSHLMGAWVQAGILGAILWFYLFFLAVKGIIRASSVRPALAPIIVFILTGLLWDILFSPFSNTRRVMVSMAIVIILDLLDFRVAVSKGPERTFRRRPVGRPYLRPTLRPR